MSKMKDVAMTTTAIAKTEINNNAPAIQYDNVWLEVAAETGNAFGRLLKFVKGKWEIGDDEVPQGTKFVCHIDQLCRGWTKFKDGEVVDLRLVKVASGDKLPDRDALGDLDKTKWEQDDDGKPKDPWVRQWYLPPSSPAVTEVMSQSQDCAVPLATGLMDHYRSSQSRREATNTRSTDALKRPISHSSAGTAAAPRQ
jgi:hypothetical protein